MLTIGLLLLLTIPLLLTIGLLGLLAIAWLARHAPLLPIWLLAIGLLTLLAKTWLARHTPLLATIRPCLTGLLGTKRGLRASSKRWLLTVALCSARGSTKGSSTLGLTDLGVSCWLAPWPRSAILLLAPERLRCPWLPELTRLLRTELTRLASKLLLLWLSPVL